MTDRQSQSGEHGFRDIVVALSRAGGAARRLTRQGGRYCGVMLKHPTGRLGFLIVAILLAVAIFADSLAPYSFKVQNLLALNQPPSWDHLLGTDEFGRDVLSRIIHGTRVSFFVGVVSVTLSVLIGGILGAIAGYCGGAIDAVITYTADVMWSFSTILLALLLVVVIGSGIESIIIAIALSYWSQYARLMRTQVMTLKNETYVEVSRALGATDKNILFRQIVPNAMAPIIVTATIGIGNAIVLEATLSFLGMGAQPPSPSWGAMMSSGATYLLIAPGVIIYPGIAMLICVLGFNLLGDALVDVMNVRGRGKES